MNARAAAKQPLRELEGSRALVGAWAKVSILQYFVAEAAVISGWMGPEPYRRSRNLISDLGAVHCGVYDGRAVCSPLHLLLNASLVAQGLGMLLGALFLSAAVLNGAGGRANPGPGHRAAGAAARTLIAVAGAGVAVVGLVPEDTVGVLHYAGAAMFFVPGALALLLLGWIWRALRSVSLLLVICGGVSLVSLAVFLLAPDHLGGLWERMVAYPITGGVALVGATVASKSHRARRSARANRAATTTGPASSGEPT